MDQYSKTKAIYMVWFRLANRRVDTETQCIYIARDEESLDTGFRKSPDL